MLKEAIEAVERISRDAEDLKTFEVVCDDGHGKPVTLRVPIVKGVPLSPVSITREGVAFARELRLANAPGPDARTGNAEHQTLDSLIAHLNRYKAPNSAVWADAEEGKVVGILDYHDAGSGGVPRWGRHRSTYDCPLSDAWSAWGGEDGLQLSQEQLAELLDSRDLDLAAGKLSSGEQAMAPNQLVMMAGNLETYSSSTAKRTRDSATGRMKLVYTEEAVVQGDIMPPKAFLIRIPVFQDSPAEVLEVRLQATVVENKAKFTLRIHDAAQKLREAFGEVLDRIAEETGIPVFTGRPE